MPAGVEVVLGIRGYAEINKVLGVLGLKQFTARTTQNIYDTKEEWYPYLPDLTQAHMRCLTRVFTNVKQSAKGRADIIADTPAGSRRFSPFSLDLYYDPGEMGDTPDTMILGIGLSGRYVPTYLDWRNEHGCIDAVKLDKHTLDMIDYAKSEISNVIPVAAEFEVMFVEVWY